MYDYNAMALYYTRLYMHRFCDMIAIYCNFVVDIYLLIVLYSDILH